MTISETVRGALAKQKVSLYAVSKESKVAWATLKRFLDGANINSEQLDKLASYLGIVAGAKEPSKTTKATKKK